MQLIVLGMHRSGTSVLARLLNMMGAYFGPEGISTGANQENPKGFWERRDVRQLNDFVLSSVNCDWNKVVHFDVANIPDTVITEFKDKAFKIILEMDSHRPWLLKEPRLCLLFTLWKEVLEVPVCIHIYRNPVEVANSLYIRNAIPTHTGIALWEKYNLMALEASHDESRFIVSHNKLMKDPVSEVKYIYEQLLKCGVDGLRLPTEKEITSFIRKELYREKVSDKETSQFLNPDQIKVVNKFKSGQILNIKNKLKPSKAGMQALEQYEQVELLHQAEKNAKTAQDSATRIEADLKQQLEQQKKELTQKLHQAEKNTKAVQDSATKVEADLKQQLEQQKKELTQKLHQAEKNAKAAQDSATKAEADLKQQFEQQKTDLTQQLNQKDQIANDAQEAAFKMEVELKQQLEQQTLQLKLVKKGVIGIEQYISRQDEIIKQLLNGVDSLVTSRRWLFGNAVFSLKHNLLFKKKPAMATDYLKKVRDRYHAFKATKQPMHVHVLDALDNKLVINCGPQKPLITEPNNVKEETKAFSENLEIDIIVCVHNALDDVKKCLNSILLNTPQIYYLFIINDGSSTKTTAYLHDFSKANENVILIENDVAQGYTKAANKGLQASTADYVILLNSDTIVPRLWINTLVDCGESDQNIGIIGPLSNAASWQSVPQRFDDSGDWAINKLPNGYDVNQMSELIYQISERRFPQVSFVNGFCFAIKRSVIDSIGFLDEKAFPKGFGEENDYCLRAIDAGFSLAIADHGYVYHSKSKSYSHSRRAALSKEGGKALKLKHGPDKINNGTQALKESKALADIRKRLDDYFKEKTPSSSIGNNKMHILFLMPVRGGGGGAHSVVQEVTGMRSFGVDAKVATTKEYEKYFKKNYPKQYSSNNYFIFYKDDTELQQLAVGFDIVVATLFSTPAMIKQIVHSNPDILTAYYIQDYEPWFFERGSEKWTIAFDSYTCIKDMLLFAKTNWICRTVEEKHGCLVHKVKPSIDHDIYYPLPEKETTNRVITISAMVRPNSPRRAPLETMLVLSNVKALLDVKVNIIIFGCNNNELETLKRDIANPVNVNFENRGVLTREEVADLLRESDVFVDFSTYQAFGRTGLEAMACGCAVILPSKGGVYEYAIHEENSLIVDTSNEDEMLTNLLRMIEDSELLKRCKKRGIETAKSFSVEGASLSELSLFRMALAEKKLRASPKTIAALGEKSIKNKNDRVIRIAIWPCVMGDGIEPAGSAYIRLLKTLQHPSLNNKLKIQIIYNLDDLKNTEADICVVQRNSIKNTLLSASVIKFCQNHNIKLAHEIDDDLFRMHECGHKALPDEELKALKLIIQAADHVITSSPVLRDSFKQWNANITCVPNAHDENLWLNQKGDRYIQPKAPEENNPLRILYMGTRTHENDLHVIKEAWGKIEEEYGDEVIFEVVGGASDGSLEFGQHYNDFKSGNYPEFVSWFRKQKRWHIGVIPLANTDFNRKKSYIKFLDYAALGLPIICSNIEPYRVVAKNGNNSLIVDNSIEAWHHALKLMIDNKDLRSRLSKAAFLDLTMHYCLQQRAEDFFRIYQELLEN